MLLFIILKFNLLAFIFQHSVSQLPNWIKHKHITGRTSANGNMTFEGLDREKTVILFAVAINDLVLIPYYQTPQRKLLGAHVIRDTASYAAITNTNVTVDVYYFELTQYSVSQAPIEIARTSGSTSYESFKANLPTTKMGCLICDYNNRPLCSTIFPISDFIKNNTSSSNCVDCYYVSDQSLHATAYYQNGRLYLQSGNRSVRAIFVVF